MKYLNNCSFNEEDILEKELREREKEELIRIRKSLEVTEEKNTRHTNT